MARTLGGLKNARGTDVDMSHHGPRRPVAIGAFLAAVCLFALSACTATGRPASDPYFCRDAQDLGDASRVADFCWAGMLGVGRSSGVTGLETTIKVPANWTLPPGRTESVLTGIDKFGRNTYRPYFIQDGAVANVLWFAGVRAGVTALNHGRGAKPYYFWEILEQGGH